MNSSAVAKATVISMHQRFGTFLIQRLCLHGVPLSDAEDLQQDFYISVLSGARACPKRGISSGYIAVMAGTIACDYFRRRNRLSSFIRDIRIPNSTLVLNICTHDDDIYQATTELDQQAMKQWQVEQQIAKRMEDVEQALELSKSYLCNDEVPICQLLVAKANGYTNQEIADYFGVSLSSVSRWLSKWYAWIATERKS